MPVVVTTAYGRVEDVLLRARAYANDMAVSGGDVLTDAAPFTLELVNGAYEHIQAYLASFGVETFRGEAWLLAIPANTTGDPESRVEISDSGTEIFTPSGAGEASYATPVLPDDLIAPLKLWERAAGSTDFAGPMERKNDGLPCGWQITSYLRHWAWFSDMLVFRGATQAIDVRLDYEKNLPILTDVNAPVPIRGVLNAAAFNVAYVFANPRGGAAATSFGAQGQAELDLLVNRSLRERQRVKHRRRPYRGYAGRRYFGGPGY